MVFFSLLQKIKWSLKSNNWFKSNFSGCVQLKLNKSSKIIETENKNSIGVRILNASTPKHDVTCISLADRAELCLDGVTIGRGAKISLENSAKIFMGYGSFLNDGSRIAASTEIKIGQYCSISFGVTIIDDDGHTINEGSAKSPITIEDHVWIGCNVTILKGVTLGQGSVVAAGSVVTQSCPPKSLIAGVPAKIIKTDISWK